MNFQDNPFQKNFEMWQQMGDSYMENMFALFEKNLAQSRAFQDQIQTAVSQVVDSQFEMLLSSLKAMEEQLTDLKATLDQMKPSGEGEE